MTVILAATFFLAGATVSFAHTTPVKKGPAPHSALHKQKFCHGALHAKIYCAVHEQRIAIKKVDKKIRRLASVKYVPVHLEKVNTWNLHKLQGINHKHRRVLRRLVAMPQPSKTQVYQAYACHHGLVVYGWNSHECGCLVVLWDGESGWDPSLDEVNPSSGAGGIPQAVPPSKMGLGDRWYENPLGQIDWGEGYIHDHKGYGTPCTTLAIWQSRSPHWY